MAIAHSILQQNIASEICLVDMVEDKLKGEMMDLQHGLASPPPPNYEQSEGSKVCVITAGARQKQGESRLSLVKRNVEIFKGIIPQLVKHSPNTVLLVVSNPVDVLTYVAWKLSGLPKERVFGSGTNLDSRPLSLPPERALENRHLQLPRLGDRRARRFERGRLVGRERRRGDAARGEPEIGSAEDKEDWEKSIHKQVVDSAYEVIRLKGYTSWAIGLSVASIVRAIMHNSRNVFALSTNGFHGIDKDVYLSLPSEPHEKEVEQLQKSAETLHDVQKDLDL
ncbi:Lactate malate dehydrogenase domain containing protein [Aphelenchoides fujianensis]|nr:Lactate malate dehydrogenase domain containing protein [Aphelenchoides fujianensis]